MRDMERKNIQERMSRRRIDERKWGGRWRGWKHLLV
jgi:hypothetical protein